MPQAYSNPAREHEATALPNIEYWYATNEETQSWEPEYHEEREYTPGWYWWTCFPGCIPDSEPNGPFETEAECVADFTEQDGA